MKMRWWNVGKESPSGLKLNRAWHLRQFLFALVPPTMLLVIMESVSRFDSSLHRDRLAYFKEQRAQRTKILENKEDLARTQRASVAVLQEKMDRVESTLRGITRKLGLPAEHEAPASSSPALPSSEEVVELSSLGSLEPSHKRESGIQRRRMERLEKKLGGGEVE